MVKPAQFTAPAAATGPGCQRRSRLRAEYLSSTRIAIEIPDRGDDGQSGLNLEISAARRAVDVADSLAFSLAFSCIRRI